MLRDSFGLDRSRTHIRYSNTILKMSDNITNFPINSALIRSAHPISVHKIETLSVCQPSVLKGSISLLDTLLCSGVRRCGRRFYGKSCPDSGSVATPLYTLYRRRAGLYAAVNMLILWDLVLFLQFEIRIDGCEIDTLNKADTKRWSMLREKAKGIVEEIGIESRKIYNGNA